jgi:GGDEF domain-containing protein
LNEANYRLKEASVRDYLSGLYNRRFLFDFLEKELSRAQLPLPNGSGQALKSWKFPQVSEE